MKKIHWTFLLILIPLINFFCSCKSLTKVQKLSITANGSDTNPITVRVGNFFSYGINLNLIDTFEGKINYHFVPGEMLSINRDTTVYLFYSDSITVDYRSTPTIFYSSNGKNIKYNRFYNDLSSTLAPIYQINLNFFLGKQDSIIADKNYIDNYLSRSDSFIKQQVNALCSKYQFPQSTKFEILSSILETQKLADSYFYLGNCFQKLDSLGTLQARLQYYIDKIDQQHVSVFSQKNIALLIEQIAYRLTQTSIRRIENRNQLQNYCSDVRNSFAKRSTSYNYIVSSLEIQAKKNNIKLRGIELRRLKKDAKKSIFDDATGRRAYIVKLNSLGSIIFSKEYGFYAYMNDITLASNGYCAVGTLDSGREVPDNVYILKTDFSGNVGGSCPSSDISVTKTPPEFSTVNDANLKITLDTFKIYNITLTPSFINNFQQDWCGASTPTANKTVQQPVSLPDGSFKAYTNISAREVQVLYNINGITKNNKYEVILYSSNGIAITRKPLQPNTPVHISMAAQLPGIYMAVLLKEGKIMSRQNVVWSR